MEENLYYINQNHTEYVPYTKEVTIHEHKAPTDKSIALLNEMQEKAKANIIKTIKIDENFLKAIALFYYESHVEYRINFFIRFNLNGKDYEIKNYIDGFKWKEATYGNYINLIYNLLHEKFSQAISDELFKHLNPEIKEMINTVRL